MAVVLLVLLFAGISGGLCQLGEGEVYPLPMAGNSIRRNDCMLPNYMREMCGWPGISDSQCKGIGCCWDGLAVTRCFRNKGINEAGPRPTIFSATSYHRPEGTANQGRPQVSLPRTKPPKQTVIQNAQLSSISSDVKYNGCLLHCTSMPIELRRICLYNVPEKTCVKAGCCYDEKTNQCFHSNPVKDPCPKTDECQVTLSPVPVCGNFPQLVCEAIGCCFNNISKVPTCYRKQAVGRAESPTTAPPLTTAVPPTTATINFADELKQFQDLLNSGQLSSLLPGNAAAPPTPVTTKAAPATTAKVTTDALDQLQQIQELLQAGLLPTLIPPDLTRAPVTTPKDQIKTTPPPKTAALVQKWKPRPQYDTRCDRNGYCRPIIKSCLPQKCGDPPYNPKTVKTNFNPRKIVGGSRAFPFSHPWTVMIQKVEGNRTFVCGGTIICERWIVTAAHCLDKQDGNSNEPDLDPSMYKLFFGRWRGLRSYYGTQVQVAKGTRDIEALIQHENFIPGKHRGVITHDIAMIKLKRPVIFNQYVHPICLPRQRARRGDIMFATGWGITRNIGPDASTMKQLGVQIKSTVSCRNRVPGYRNPVGLLCAGGEPNHDTCTGDSGGPLVGSKLSPVGKFSNKGKPIYYFYGLTSIGSPSCNTRQYDRQPALYTDIYYYLPWIRKNTADCCS